MTKPIDLAGYSLDELDALIAEATALRDKLAADEIAELEERINKLKSKKVPFQAVHIGGGGGSRPKPLAKATGSAGDGRASPKPQFRGPDGKEYSGRGGLPKWAREKGFTEWSQLEEWRIRD